MPPMIRRLVAFVVLAAVGASPAYAKATTIHCPQSIVEKPSVAQVPAVCILVADSGLRPLEQAGVYVVISGEYSAQVPDSTKSARREERVNWRLPASPADTYWIGCAYSGTTAKLMIRLAPDVESCDVSYALLPTGKRQRLDRISCR